MAASRASFRGCDIPGRRHGGSPKVVLDLIGCFCHKELFCVLFESQANHQNKLLQRRTLTQAKGGGWPCRAARITLSTPDFPILHDLPGRRTYPLWFATEARVLSQRRGLPRRLPWDETEHAPSLRKSSPTGAIGYTKRTCSSP